MLILLESLAILLIFYILFRSVFITHAINIPKPVAIVIFTVSFLVLPAPIKAMFIILAISAFAVWLAFFVEYNNNQSRWMQFIRKYF